MGLLFSSFIDEIVNNFRKPTSILILGLDNAGKTQVLYCMKLDHAITNTVPTLGFNLEEFNYKNLSIKAWDLGGQTKFRAMWHHYFEDVNGIIFVIDSQDRSRFADAKNELENLLNNEKLSDVPFLVFANKQDLPDAAEITEIKRKFDWAELSKLHNIHMVACVASENHKINVGLDWLSSAIR